MSSSSDEPLFNFSPCVNGCDGPFGVRCSVCNSPNRRIDSVRRTLEWWDGKVLEAERDLAISVEHRDYWRTRLTDAG